MKTTKIIKSLVAVGLISTAKIAANFLLDDPIGKAKEKEKESKIVEIQKTKLSKVLSDIREEMVVEMEKLSPNEKLLKNYVRGRIATLDDVAQRYK